MATPPSSRRPSSRPPATLATFVGIATEASATYTAAVCAPVAIGLVAFLPGLSARFARLPIGYAAPQSATDEYIEHTATPDRYETEPYGDRSGSDQQDPGTPLDAEAIAAQARRGHEMLLGLVGGCAAVAVGSAAVLGFSDNTWGRPAGPRHRPRHAAARPSLPLHLPGGVRPDHAASPPSRC